MAEFGSDPSIDDIAPVIDRTPGAARQLAARARRRVQAAPKPDPDLARQPEVVDDFLTAARAGNIRGLLEVLDPDVVFRADVGVAIAGTAFPVVGAQAVAERVLQTAPRFAPRATPAIVNGQAGAVFASDGGPVGVIGFTVVNDLIAGIDLIADPASCGTSPMTSCDAASLVAVLVASARRTWEPALTLAQASSTNTTPATASATK